MAYFHCLIGGGSSGGGYELTVTCDADFAGTTITATDGVTTLTQTCPSASPYEVIFEIPNGGDWTISGVIGGRTVSTGVNIPTSATLFATIQQTVTIYSAKEDTISYTDIDGATQTITFASGETSKQVQISIEPSGSSITFTSGVAKDPSDLTAYYSKTVTIDSNTTEVYIMPDNALYWWGYVDGLESISTANGWSAAVNLHLASDPSWTTNHVTCYTNTNYYIQGVGTSSAKTLSNVKFHFIGYQSVSSNGIVVINAESSKSEVGGNQTQAIFNTADLPTSLDYVVSSSLTLNNEIIGALAINASAQMVINALWYE